MDLEDMFMFGKHIRKTVAAVLEIDPGYVVWLRAQKIEAGETNAGFTDQVHILLNTFIAANPKEMKKYRPYGTEVTVEEVEAPAEKDKHLEPELAPEGWGQW